MSKQDRVRAVKHIRSRPRSERSRREEPLEMPPRLESVRFPNRTCGRPRAAAAAVGMCLSSRRGLFSCFYLFIFFPPWRISQLPAKHEHQPTATCADHLQSGIIPLYSITLLHFLFYFLRVPAQLCLGSPVLGAARSLAAVVAGWGCCGAGGCRWTGAGCACHCSPLAAAGTWRCCRCLLSNLSLSQRGAEAHDMDQALNLMTQYIKTHVCALMSPFGALHFAFLEPFNFSCTEIQLFYDNPSKEQGVFFFFFL